MQRPKRIIVLGNERSGTSVVTEMIHRWGAYAGPPDKLARGDEHNPHGQWELEPLWDLLTEIGDFGEGATWWSEDFEARIVRKLQDEATVAKAQKLIAEMELDGRPWVWKDPALCHFLPFWQPIWGDVVYVITVRHPYDVARSWQHMAVPATIRDSVDLIACNLLRWQHMTLCVLRATEATERKIFVEFERLVRRPAAEARRLAMALDQHVGQTTTDDVIRSMAAAVDSDLHRNRFDRPLADVADSTVAQQELYELLRRKVDDPRAAIVDHSPMPEGWWQFVHESEAVIRGG